MTSYFSSIRATPPLNAEQYSVKILTEPLLCLQKVKVWLQSYVDITAKKICVDDYDYRQICMDLAQTLLDKIAFIEKDYPQDTSERKQLLLSHLEDLDYPFKLTLCDFKDKIASFFAEEDEAKIPRKKNKSIWQIVNSLFHHPSETDTVDYQSISFLEDLEALLNLMQSRWLMQKNDDGQLVLFTLHFSSDDDPESQQSTEFIQGGISLEQLRQNEFLQRCHIKWNNFYQLMVCYAQIKSERYQLLQKFNITVPANISRFATVKQNQRQILRELFSALTAGADKLVDWCDKYKSVDFSDFFSGAFGEDIDVIMQQILPVLQMNLAQQLQELHESCIDKVNDDMLVNTEEPTYDMSAYEQGLLKIAYLYSKDVAVKQNFIDGIFNMLTYVGCMKKHGEYYLLVNDKLNFYAHYCNNMLKHWCLSPQQLENLSVAESDLPASSNAVLFALRAAFVLSSAELVAYFSRNVCAHMYKIFEAVPGVVQKNLGQLVSLLRFNINTIQALGEDAFLEKEYEDLLKNVSIIEHGLKPIQTPEGIEMQTFSKPNNPSPLAPSSSCF